MPDNLAEQNDAIPTPQQIDAWCKAAMTADPTLRTRAKCVQRVMEDQIIDFMLPEIAPEKDHAASLVVAVLAGDAERLASVERMIVSQGGSPEKVAEYRAWIEENAPTITSCIPGISVTSEQSLSRNTRSDREMT